MTRESRARWLAFATAVLVVLLAALFAWLRNLTPAPQATPDRPATNIDSHGAAGRAAFARMGCMACHSAQGRGNPALPLDGVGARRSREQLRAAAFASGAAPRELPSSIAAAKRANANDPEAEALLDYLQRLRQP